MRPPQVRLHVLHSPAMPFQPKAENLQLIGQLPGLHLRASDVVGHFLPPSAAPPLVASRVRDW